MSNYYRNIKTNDLVDVYLFGHQMPPVWYEEALGTNVFFSKNRQGKDKVVVQTGLIRNKERSVDDAVLLLTSTGQVDLLSKKKFNQNYRKVAA